MPLNFYQWLMAHKAFSKAQRDFIEDSKGYDHFLSAVQDVDDLLSAMRSVRRSYDAGCEEAVSAGKRLVKKYRKYLGVK